MLKLVETLVESAIAGFYFLLAISPKSPDLPQKARIIAHRGNTGLGHTENTLSAFDACLAHQVWGIEFDVRWTEDNEPLVHHDTSTERVFGVRHEISSETAEDLRKSVPEIPTLSEVVAKYGKKMHLMIEIKDLGEVSKLQLRRLAEVLAPLTPIKDYHIMSLDLEELAKLPFPEESKVSIAILNVSEVSDYTLKKDWAAFTAPYFLVSNRRRKRHFEKHQMVGTGFISNRSIAFRELNRGITWLFTNHAVTLQRELQD